MMMFTTILRFICLLISLFGASVFIRRRADIGYAFGMSIASAFIVSILFFASLFMPITVVIWVLFGVGILLLIIELIRKEIHKEDILNWTNLFLFIGIVIIFVYLAGRRFIFIDDYTHWGVIARHLVENQALPTASDFLITFPSYAPGSALWVTYVATLTGDGSEGMMLIAQAFLILVFSSSLTGFTFCKKEKAQTVMAICMVVLAMVLCAVSMTFSTTILSLCVDGLLTTCALSGIFFLILSDASMRAKAWFLIPLMVTVIVIKSAGMLYAAAEFAVLLYLYVYQKKHAVRPIGGMPGMVEDVPAPETPRQRGIIGLIAAPIICALAQLFWTLHVKAAFPNAGSSMHAMSIARWKEVYESRGAELIQTILHEFFRKITLWYLVFFVVALIVLYVFIYICGRKANHRIARRSLWLLLLCLIHYVIYLGSMLFVYLFSMSPGEASFLAAFDRYLWVELIFLVGIILCFLFHLFSQYEEGFGDVSTDEATDTASSGTGFRAFAIRHGVGIRLIPLIVAAVCGVAFVLLFWKFGPKYEIDYQKSTIRQINELSPESYTGDILIYAPSQMDQAYDESLLLYFGRYKFRTPSASVMMFERGDVETKLSQYTHLFIAEPDDQLTDYLRGQGWTCDIVPGLYDVESKSLVTK